MLVQLIGWASSLVLVATIGAQLHRQWKSESSKGVSLWLYYGQFVASVGLLVYSILGRQWVFVVLNAVMATAAAGGAVISSRYRNRD